MKLWTIGHGNRAASELAVLLGAAGVEELVDVRRYPASRRNPQFNRSAMEPPLAAAGVGYQWAGEALGGRRRPTSADSRHPAWRDQAFRAYADYMDSGGFREAFSDLLRQAPERRIAIMCAETLWWKCHRRLMSDAAALRGVEVVHLVSTAPGEPHRLHPAVRAGADGWPVYDVGIQPALLPTNVARVGPKGTADND